MTVRILIASALLLAGFVGQSYALSPSFDCKGVTQPDLVAICGNEKLARTDLMTTEMFERARKINRVRALAIARAFLKDRANCGRDENCILVRQTAALAEFGKITGDISSSASAASDPKPDTRDGLIVKKYQDGSGSVRVGDRYDAPGWSYNCRVDKMSDKRACYISANEIGGPFISYGGGSKPAWVCILGHDFPGRHGMIRIDRNSPIETSAEGCVSADDVLAQMLGGQTFISRSYRWPRDWSVDQEIPLYGLKHVLEVVDEVLAGNVR